MTPQQQAYAVWSAYGHSEDAMLSVLEHLIATIEELKEKGTEQ
jgi:hypothetical protein